MIIGISGYAGSGKDTAGQVLIDHWGFTKGSFAGPIKDMVSKEFGLDRFMLEGTDCKMREIRDNPKFGAYGKSPRKLLQDIGTFYNTAISETYWSDKIEKIYLETKKDMVVTDVRFPCEVKMIEDNGGFVVRLERPDFNGMDHISERSLENHVFENIIMNDKSMCEFKVQVFNFMKERLNEKTTI